MLGLTLVRLSNGQPESSADHATETHSSYTRCTDANGPLPHQHLHSVHYMSIHRPKPPLPQSMQRCLSHYTDNHTHRRPLLHPPLHTPYTPLQHHSNTDVPVSTSPDHRQTTTSQRTRDRQPMLWTRTPAKLHLAAAAVPRAASPDIIALIAGCCHNVRESSLCNDATGGVVC